MTASTNYSTCVALWSELEELESIYGDNFPEPSEQLDRWNKVWDKYHYFRARLSPTELQDIIKTENGDYD